MPQTTTTKPGLETVPGTYDATLLSEALRETVNHGLFNRAHRLTSGIRGAGQIAVLKSRELGDDSAINEILSDIQTVGSTLIGADFKPEPATRYPVQAVELGRGTAWHFTLGNTATAAFVSLSGEFSVEQHGASHAQETITPGGIILGNAADGHFSAKNISQERSATVLIVPGLAN